MSEAPHSVVAVAAELGEGPVWRNGQLWFVDIKGRRIHAFSPAAERLLSWETPAPAGFLAVSGDGRWIVGLKTGLHWFDPSTSRFDLLHPVEDPMIGNRLNDGAVDPQGRLWFGSMHDAETADSGRLYRLGPAGPQAIDSGYCIPNGPAFSPDGATLYHTDTLRRTIYAFAVDAKGGLSDKRVFATIPDRAGYPDGPTVDAEGCLWTGLFGGWGAWRLSPAGEVVETVAFPVANVTKIAFGGEDLRTAYATTAWKGLTGLERRQQPQAGDIFAFRVETPGLPCTEFRHG